jgi:DNA-binding SARP family transcriptional activator
MESRILGPFEVVADDQALALGSAQQRAGLVLLLIRAAERCVPDRLVDELW